MNANGLVCQRYLMSSYRVGMVALETLGRRVSEDRPQTKFTRNPSYAEDVKWLLGVAKKLGLPCMQNFLMCVMATVVSPFVLQELTWGCGCYLSNVAISTSNASGSQQSNAVIHQIRTQPYLTSLVQKCYQVLPVDFGFPEDSRYNIVFADVLPVHPPATLPPHAR